MWMMKGRVTGCLKAEKVPEQVVVLLKEKSSGLLYLLHRSCGFFCSFPHSSPLILPGL